MQQSGGGAECGLELRHRDRSDRAQCAKVQIFQSLHEP